MRSLSSNLSSNSSSNLNSNYNPDNSLSTSPIIPQTAVTPLTISLPGLQRIDSSSNQAPVNIIPSSQFMNEDETLVFVNASGNAISVLDNDNVGSSLSVNLIAKDGTIKINTFTGVNVENNNTGNVTVTGLLENVNQVLNGLEFRATQDFFGETDLVIRSNDQGAENNLDEDRIILKVNSVNDAPSFTKGNNITVDENATILPTAWARNISAGADNESGQELSFVVTNNNRSLFTESGQPTISADGILSYQLAANANGVAQVSVRLQDNDGGNNLSSLETFTITVNPINNAPENILTVTDLEIDEDISLTFIDENKANILSIQDVDAGTNPIKVNISVNQGNLSVISSNSVKIDGNNSDNLLLQGTVSNINQLLSSLVFQPNTNFNGDVQLSVKTNDNGATGGGINQIDEDTFTIKVNPVNDAPSFTKGADEIINEDAPVREVKNWAKEISTGAVNETSQQLSFIVTNNNNELFAEQPQISSDGTLTYKVAENANGTAIVTVTLNDGQQEFSTSQPQTFNITVNSVNDAPKFDLKTTKITIDEDSESQTIPDLLTNISAGADNESQQQLTLNLTNDNPQLFSQAPAISRDGTLTFTPAENAFGIATVSVQLTDDGGVNNGGANTSTIKTLTIEINPINDAPDFSIGRDITVNAGAGEQIITNWSSGFIPGPTNEDNQKVSRYEITDISNPDIFATEPVIRPDGTLVFTPIDNLDVVTNTTISVRVIDDGGTANGGKDFSETKTFDITVNPLLMNLTPSQPEIQEGDTDTSEYKFTFGLTSPSRRTVTVNYTIVDESATTADGDYQIANKTGTLVFNPGQTQRELVILVNGDRKFETDQTFRIDWTNSLGQEGSTSGKILNDDVRPMIAIAGVSQREGDRGNQPYEFVVSLDRASDEIVAVDYAIADGTAKVSTGDYTVESARGTLEFAPGTTTQKIIVDVNGDTRFEPLESFSISLSNPENAAIATGKGLAVGVISDDEGSSNRDSNGDGSSDIIWRNSRDGRNGIWSMTGLKTQTTQFFETVGDRNWQIEQVIDFDSDGKSDLFWRNHITGENAIWTMDGSTILDKTFIVSTNEPGWQLVGAADLMGDGGVDLVWRNYLDGRNAIWEMDGNQRDNGVFIESITDINWQIEDIGDFDGDGKGDLLWRNHVTGDNGIWFMNGNTVKEKQFVFPVVDKDWHIAGVADMDNDGIFDIVWQNYTTGENAIWNMNRNQPKATNLIASIPEQNTAWRIESLQDFTGDGKVDILWRNYDSGENAVWGMDNTNRIFAEFIDPVSEFDWQII